MIWRFDRAQESLTFSCGAVETFHPMDFYKHVHLLVGKRDFLEMLRPPRHRRSDGQSIIEASISIILIAFILLGVLQVTRLYVAKEFVDYSASAASRARAVGFNDFMVFKVARVASIPNAGAMTNPNVQGIANNGFWATATVGEAINRSYQNPPVDPRRAIERSRIPSYLGAENHGRLAGLLDYEDWETIRLSRLSALGSGEATAGVTQDFPADFPFMRAFYARDSVRLTGQASLAPHAEVYLE